MVAYFKSVIPNCSITHDEIELFKPVYEQSSMKQLNRVFHQAIRQNAMQPVSYMTRQLQITRPSSDPFNAPKSRTHDWQGRTIEQGTDWQKKYEEIDRQNAIKRQSYDAKHGAGSYDRNMKKYRADLHRYFVGLCDKKTSSEELQPLSKEIDQNGKELGLEAYKND